MKKVLLLKFGELFLKGRNRREFIKLLKRNIIKKLKNYEFVLQETQGRLVVSDFKLDDEDVIIEKIQQVFGLIGVASATEIDATLQDIETFVENLDLSATKTFKVEVKRADKTLK